MADTYKIYQLHDTPEYHGIRFFSMEENQNYHLDIRDYDLVYQGNVSDFSSENLLEDIYRKFNIDRPEDFRGYSLSVSDVIVTDINNEQKAWYCDRVGFKEMPEFFTEQKEAVFNYEKAFAEMLDFMEFSLVKYEDGSFGLHDYQDANLGNIEEDRFENAAEIIERFTYNTYFEDYFFDNAVNDISYRQENGTLILPDDFKMPETAEEWVNFLEEYHLTETYADTYQAARLLTDYENVRAVSLDNIPHEDYENKRDCIQTEHD